MKFSEFLLRNLRPVQKSFLQRLMGMFRTDSISESEGQILQFPGDDFEQTEKAYHQYVEHFDQDKEKNAQSYEQLCKEYGQESIDLLMKCGALEEMDGILHPVYCVKCIEQDKECVCY